MIISGKSRAGPRQLAAVLLCTESNDAVDVLHVDFSASGNPAEAIEDMQILSMATRGTKGLYHARIDPGAYAMTEAQWLRTVEVLEEELGLHDQPKVIVLHESDGDEHLHVVWARTDMDTWMLRRDSLTYAAHERASLRLEREFGHEHLPGKFVKADPGHGDIL